MNAMPVNEVSIHTLKLLFNTTIYVLRRFDDIRYLHQELWSPDVGMVIKES